VNSSRSPLGISLDSQRQSAIPILILGERPALFHAIGYILIIAGVVVAQKWAKSSQ
jgi:uncharacterized membrane protein